MQFLEFFEMLLVERRNLFVSRKQAIVENILVGHRRFVFPQSKRQFVLGSFLWRSVGTDSIGFSDTAHLGCVPSPTAFIANRVAPVVVLNAFAVRIDRIIVGTHVFDIVLRNVQVARASARPLP